MVVSRLALFLLVAGVMVLASGQWDAYSLYDEVRVDPPSAVPACSGECQRGYDWAIANEVNEDRLCEGRATSYAVALIWFVKRAWSRPPTSTRLPSEGANAGDSRIRPKRVHQSEQRPL